MNNDRKYSFLLYTFYRRSLKNLTNAQRGRLLMAIFDYVDDGLIPDFDGVLKVAFDFIADRLDYDRRAWEEEKQRKSESTRRSAQARWSKKEEIPVPVTETVSVSGEDANAHDGCERMRTHTNVSDEETEELLKELEKEEKHATK